MLIPRRVYTYTFRCIPASLYIVDLRSSYMRSTEGMLGPESLFDRPYLFVFQDYGSHTIHWDWNIYLHLKLMFMVFMHVNIPSHGSYGYLPIFLLGANCIFRVVEISIVSHDPKNDERAVAFNGQCNKRHHSAWMAQGIHGWLFCFEKPLNRNH